MLSQEDNELLCRVGPGTPMGDLMRQHWIPAVLSSELPHADSDPMRVMLLGEQLIAFRDTNGTPAMSAAASCGPTWAQRLSRHACPTSSRTCCPTANGS